MCVDDKTPGTAGRETLDNDTRHEKMDPNDGSMFGNLVGYIDMSIENLDERVRSFFRTLPKAFCVKSLSFAAFVPALSFSPRAEFSNVFPHFPPLLSTHHQLFPFSTNSISSITHFAMNDSEYLRWIESVCRREPADYVGEQVIEYLNKKGYSRTEAMLRMESSNMETDPRMPNTPADANRVKYPKAFGKTSICLF
jgi:hypothetical protein